MGEGGYRQINKAFNASAFDDYLAGVVAQLPDLPNVEQVSPRVIRILGQNAGKFTLQGTNTYIVGTGSRRIIVDTAQGFREWIDLVDETLNAAGVKLSHVLLTHWHGDHTGGVPDLISMYPELEKAVFKNSPDIGQRSIEDGSTFQVEGATVRAIYSPGHSYDHMCFVLEEENAIFTGDNILGHGSSVIEDLSAFTETLHDLQRLECSVGYPAHGAIISNLPAKIKREIALKSARETKCLLALKRIHGEKRKPGERVTVTIEELVDELHGAGLDAKLQRLVLAPSTHEILKKLVNDGKVAFEVRRGVQRWFAIDKS